MQKGFTVIELIIVVAILGILGTIVAGAIFGSSNDTQLGWAGATETRCHGGMQVVVGQNGYVQQIIDQNGHGIPCK